MFLGSTGTTCSFVPTCGLAAVARRRGQGWPQATAQRREASLTAPSTAAESPARGCRNRNNSNGCYSGYFLRLDVEVVHESRRFVHDGDAVDQVLERDQHAVGIDRVVGEPPGQRCEHRRGVGVRTRAVAGGGETDRVTKARKRRIRHFGHTIRKQGQPDWRARAPSRQGPARARTRAGRRSARDAPASPAPENASRCGIPGTGCRFRRRHKSSTNRSSRLGRRP